jgi:hypothetical protein
MIGELESGRVKVLDVGKLERLDRSEIGNGGCGVRG